MIGSGHPAASLDSSVNLLRGKRAGELIVPTLPGDPFPDDYPTQADRIVIGCAPKGEDPYGLDRRWFHRILKNYHPDFSAFLAKKYQHVYKRSGRHDAALFITEAGNLLDPLTIELVFDDFEIRCLARHISRAGLLTLNGLVGPIGERALQLFCTRRKTPVPDARTLAGAIARASCEYWWRRNLRRIHPRSFDDGMRRLGLVSRRQGIYVSDQILVRHRKRNARTRALLRELQAVNELGEALSLESIQEHSISNPSVRRSELMTRIAGFECVAEELSYQADFYTITVPGRMHCCHSRSGDKNDRFDGTQVHQAQKYLCKQWSKARAKLHRQGIRPFGFRIAEPHHDGTPHWHLLLFVNPDKRDQLRQTLYDYALQVDPDEPGAKEHRFSALSIDPSQGSAAGYIAKYVSKNIDGHGIENDSYGKDAATSAERIQAWASVHGIRQFQQIGGPPVGVWRELRRVSEPIGCSSILEAARQAADDGDWGKFLRIMGGPNLSRERYPIRLRRVWSDKLNRYGEPKGFQPLGLQCDEVTICTRSHNWRIEFVFQPSKFEAMADLRTSSIALSDRLQILSKTFQVTAALEFCQ